MKKLTIRWQRLVDESGLTCARCANTQSSVEAAFMQLKKSLPELGIAVELIKERVKRSDFEQDPLISNQIWLNDKLLEEWIGAIVGKSRCCDLCGESECRTISISHNTFAAIPKKIIIQAALVAAASLLTE